MNQSNPEVWRFFTYSFVHAGWEHLLGNMLMQLIIGIPLEYCHGTMRVMSLYTIGVIVGSFTALIGKFQEKSPVKNNELLTMIFGFEKRL